jgi:hypothetical protein
MALSILGAGVTLVPGRHEICVHQAYFFSLFLLDDPSDFFELSAFAVVSDLEESSGFDFSFFEESPLDEEGAVDFLA